MNLKMIKVRGNLKYQDYANPVKMNFLINMKKYYLFKDSKNKTRIPNNAIVELIEWNKNRNVLIKYHGETIKSMGYHLRKLKFKEVKQEIIDKLSYKSRSLSPTDLKERLLKYGFIRICLGCGIELTGRKQSWCSSDCSSEFTNKYIWNILRERMLKLANHKCQSGSCKKEMLLEVHHIHPIALGGNPFDEENLTVVCPDCHLDAHAELGITMKDYRDKEYYENYAKERRIKTLDKFGVII